MRRAVPQGSTNSPLSFSSVLRPTNMMTFLGFLPLSILAISALLPTGYAPTFSLYFCNASKKVTTSSLKRAVRALILDAVHDAFHVLATHPTPSRIASTPTITKKCFIPECKSAVSSGTLASKNEAGGALIEESVRFGRCSNYGVEAPERRAHPTLDGR